MQPVKTDEPALFQAPVAVQEQRRLVPEYEVGSFRILRLVVKVGECNSAYNQFTLPLRGRYQTTICTYFRAEMPLADDVTVLEGDGTFRGFLRNVRQVMEQEDFDVIHAHSPHVACLFLLTNLFRRKRMARTVFTAHNSYQNFKPRNKLLLIPPFLGFRRTVCCGAAAAESFPRLYRLFAGRRLRAVTNGVNLRRIDDSPTAATPRRGDAAFNAVSVGRLITIKDPLTVLRAFRSAAGDGARLTFLGEGNRRGDVEAEIERLGLRSTVDAPGNVPRDSVYDRLRRADVFVSASHGEGLPIAVLEAMACSCPVILSDIPPHREIAAGADYIPLVKPGDVDGFARELIKLQEMPAVERANVGRRCRQLVEQRFSLEAMHQGYDRLYAELVDAVRA